MITGMAGRPTIRCGNLIRNARERHGLGQAELARRIGTAQPAISRLERDSISPSLETLNRLLEAMGETLTLTASRLDSPSPGGGNQSIAELRADFRDLSAEQRLVQAAKLSEVSTQLAVQAEP